MFEFRKKLKYNLDVIDIRDVTPLVRRVTFKGDLFATALPCQPSQWLKLFLPSGGSQVSRAYTIRRHYPQSGNVDIDFVRHDHGPAGRWAEQAQFGDQIGCSALRGGFQPQEDAEWMLLAADETGTPAVMSILESLSPGDRALVVLEAETMTELQALDSLAAVNCEWFFRDEHPAGSNLLLQGIDRLQLPSGVGQFWIAGEAQCVNEVRDYLTEACSIPRRLVRSKGYWMRGVADHRDRD
ncbi:siderophore-interacting protein [Pseudomonas sp. SBB6]|uniref:siderophore-interacting protein n=1 Tax=Pseudomonas sp. SBB6 TaxID=2962032 RepID=UPI0020B8AB71|nr:siderophore-interacting protein [Pseudomonas sp. SBB6]MCP3751615.1 siderophore-interacting protein [Pseudomonas sp. SBB6]